MEEIKEENAYKHIYIVVKSFNKELTIHVEIHF